LRENRKKYEEESKKNDKDVDTTGENFSPKRPAWEFQKQRLNIS